MLSRNMAADLKHGLPKDLITYNSVRFLMMKQRAYFKKLSVIKAMLP